MKFKSQVFTQASGSIGGQTFSHNKGGMYTRARAIPTDPLTIRQQAVRAITAALVNAWNALTPAQRTAWATYAAAVTVTNTLGDAIQLSGMNMYVRSNSARLQGQAAIVNAAPTLFNTGEPNGSIQSAVLAAGTLTVTSLFAAPASAAGFTFLYIGAPMNAGQTFSKGPYQLAMIGTFIAAAVGASLVALITDPTQYRAAIPPVIGQKRPMRLVNIFDDGRVSADLKTTFVIA